MVSNPVTFLTRRSDGEDDDDGETNSDRAFITNSQGASADETPDDSFHQAVDALHRGSGQFVAPFFPLAFAVSPDRPLDFNFDLRLLDELTLPRPILSRDEDLVATLRDAPTTEGEQKVTFANAQEAVTHCRQKLREGWAVPRERGSHARGERQARLSHPDLDKDVLFRSEGKALDKALASGQKDFDSNLHLVRLDR